jgi:hypothetical protein
MLDVYVPIDQENAMPVDIPSKGDLGRILFTRRPLLHAFINSSCQCFVIRNDR